MNHLPELDIRLNRKQHVLKALIELRLNNVPYYLGDTRECKDNVISGGFRPIYYFTSKHIGGSAGNVRMNDLKLHHGVPILMKTHIYIDGSGIKRTAWIYRINLTIDEIKAYDWSGAWDNTKKDWVFGNRMYIDPKAKRMFNEVQPTFNEDKHGQIGFNNEPDKER